jgi:hypothetical protein
MSEWGNPARVISGNPEREATLGELNHLSNPRKRNQCRNSLSSGERKGKSLKPVNVIASTRYSQVVAGKIRTGVLTGRLLPVL